MDLTRGLWLGVVIIVATTIGCQSATDGSKAKDKVYDFKAKVVTVDTAKKSVTVDHEDIPGLMPAMKMTLAVESAQMLEGIKPGDDVTGKLRVRAGEYLIIELRKR